MACTAKDKKTSDQHKENRNSSHGTRQSNSTSKKKKREARPSRNMEPLQPSSKRLNTEVQMQDGDDNHNNEDEVTVLKVKLAQAEAAKATAARTSNDTAKVKVLTKPRGEAGDGKRGYNLRHAMELRGKKGKEIYNEILESVRIYTIQAGLDFKKSYRYQDHLKIGNVFTMVCSVQPSMTQDCFPVNWAAAAMLKQFLGNHRRWLRKKGCLPASPTKGSTKGKARAQLENRRGSGSGSSNSDSRDESASGCSGLRVVD
ncbi:hypothetical protein FIBSPDRAFT_968563 [Athelia psychrophila]|uniref:Uncharacterized protein n=1 Tax=Athelia psychrophila TaxID=1759441 RepID=A0A167UGU6_9AGAM|nr:hypothetical protein FIBSPDRAFT_968563 [Fibularhizoctonia sp. CBS 109695]